MLYWHKLLLRWRRRR